MTETLSPYQEIAETRPRLRGDVLYTRTPSGVLFHNAQGGFNVSSKEAYKFATVLVPHLNGERRVEELCHGLGERQRDMVVRLVRALYARGFARDVPPPGAPEKSLPAPVAERFAEQIGYLDHYADAPTERFRRFRDTRVAVLGDDPLARWCALSLLRNGCGTVAVTGDLTGAAPWREVREEAAALESAGCPVTLTVLDRDGGPAPGDAPVDWSALAPYDVVVVTGRDTGVRQVVRLLEQGVPAGRTLLPAWPFGRRLLVGPSMTAQRAGCWVCAALRLGACGDATDAARLWSGMSPAAPLDGGPAPVTGPLAAMAGNLLGYEVFRQRTGALPAETERQILVQDLDSLDVAGEPLLPHPRCPYCSDARQDADAEPVAVPTADDLDAAGASAARSTLPADGAADEQAARDALAALDRRAALVQERAGVFCGFADEDHEQTPLKLSTVRVGVAPGSRRHVSACDVHHVAGARLRALFRAAEVYAEHVVPPVVFQGAALQKAQATRPLTPVTSFATSSGLDVPADTVDRWGTATSLLDGRSRLVPAAALRPFGPDNATGGFERTSAGLGAAATRDAAVARALASALAHDALRSAVRRRSSVTSIPQDGLADDAELLFLTRSAGHLGVTAELLDLGAQHVAAVLARAVDPHTGAWHWSLAAGPRRRDAVFEALRDLLGAVQLAAQQQPVDTGDALWADLDAGTLDATGACPVNLDAATGWHAVLEGLRAAGRDALVVDAGAADLRSADLHVARVLLVDGADRGV